MWVALIRCLNKKQACFLSAIKNAWLWNFHFMAMHFFIISVCFFFHDGGTLIGIYLLDLYVLTFHDMGYGTGKR